MEASSVVDLQKCLNILTDELRATHAHEGLTHHLRELISKYIVKLWEDKESTSCSSKTSSRDDNWIILEGLDGSGKSTTSAALAAELEAKGLAVQTLRTPPIELKDVRSYFDHHPNKYITKMYYQFGNYVAAYLMKTNLDKRIFIIDRFWPSTVANQEANLALSRDSEVTADSAIYKWPSDMYKPSKVLMVFLHISEEERIRRLGARSGDENTVWEENLQKVVYRKNVEKGYNQIEGMIRIDASQSTKEVVQEILKHAHL
eukprot:TRINITY_DN4266_c0_g1_i1.p1 TRINITY_DN4266_c0_g1~~TRINITY_DN4266_c0_g1_i1.p1  ORF type:complete len:260 (-),score=38.04 TRINITY_DN4266_c0_g1_i1:35-814(-)